jgi:hypothetical protein
MEDNNYKFENTGTFDILLIKPTEIDHLDWKSVSYTNDILNLDCYELLTASSENFINILAENLQIDKYNYRKDLVEVVPQVICEMQNYIYEILYIDEINENDDKINNLGNLLNINGKKIYGNVILMKTYVPSLSKSIIIENIIKDDIKIILDKRVNTNIVLFDSEWSDKIVIGNLEEFANTFFEGPYYKFETGFLMHNINIWYELCEGCSTKTCGTIIQKPVYKCLWFSMITDEYRGSLYLDEVKKIIKISEKLDKPYNPKEEWIAEEKDEYNRKVIKNKYKVLDLAFRELFS